MTTQPVNIYLSIGQRGREDVIQNAGALAVANHILRTERNRDEIDVYTTDRFIDSVNIPEYNRVVSLEQDPLVVKNLDDSLYRYLLYYYMSMLNRPEDINIIPRIDPRYVGGLSNEPGTIDEMLRSRTVDFRIRLNNARQYVENLNLRVTYAPIINGLLSRYPLSDNVASYISDTIMKSSLRYRELISKNRTHIPIAQGLLSNPSIPERFYASIDDVPLNEILFEMVQAAHLPGVGFYYRTMFADSIPMMAKISDRSNMETIYEYQVGTYLNQVYDDCPFILYSYGLINSFIMEQTLQNYVPVLDNDSDYWIGPMETPATAIYLSQWIEDGMSLREFISDERQGYRFDDEDEIVQQSVAETFKSIMIAVLCSIQYLYQEVGFVHNSLSFDNIVIRILPEPVRIPLPGHDDKYFNSNCVPIIVNLYSSSLLGGTRGPREALIATANREAGITTDIRSLTEVKNIVDYETLLISVLQFHETFNTWETEDSIVDDLIAFHLQLITDRVLDPVNDESEFRFVKDSLLKIIDTPELEFRSLPFQWNQYNVKDSIDNLISKWLLDDDMGEHESDIQTPIDIDALISSQYESGRIVATTYPGILLNSDLPANIRRYRTSGVDDSMNSLSMRLSNSVQDQLSFLNRYYPGDDIRRNLVFIQGSYRDQINKLIRARLVSEGIRWINVSQTVEMNLEDEPTLVMINRPVDITMDIEDIEELLRD